MPNPTLQQIDAEIDRLLAIRKAILNSELQTARQNGKMLADIIRKATTFTHPEALLVYVSRYILPWKLFLSANHFPDTMDVLPDTLPGNWDCAQAISFIHTLSSALRQDREALEEFIKLAP
jgi:hypothetical protein